MRGCMGCPWAQGGRDWLELGFICNSRCKCPCPLKYKNCFTPSHRCRLLGGIPELWAMGPGVFLAASTPSFLPKAENSGGGVSTDRLAVSRGGQWQTGSFIAPGGGLASMGRSAAGEKVFGVQQWFSLHCRSQHGGLCIPSHCLPAERGQVWAVQAGGPAERPPGSLLARPAAR